MGVGGGMEKTSRSIPIIIPYMNLIPQTDNILILIMRCSKALQTHTNGWKDSRFNSVYIDKWFLVGV